jgi:hypothetical protein
MLRRGFFEKSNWEKKVSGHDQFNFHRRCTGNAEKQFSIPSPQLSFDSENQPRIFADSRPSKQGRVLNPAHCPCFS